MKKRTLILAGLVILIAAVPAAIGYLAGRDGLLDVRLATVRFQATQAAESAGWVLVPGLDHCFDNPGVGGMGYHYINPALLDTQLDRTQPEALVYAPDRQGRLKLAAVEYIVPAEAWDATGNPELPQLHGHTFHLNEALGVYVLHAWIWQNNPAGLFEDWNPQVSCSS